VVLEFLTGGGEAERRRLGSAARERVLADHTAAHRAGELEAHIARVRSRPKKNRMSREMHCATAE
jgi:spore maturation protein CgeB